MISTIKDVVSNIDQIQEDTMIYARRIDGIFLPHSEIVILELTDEEHAMKTKDLAILKCPGFDYFLESFIIKEILEGVQANMPDESLDKKVSIIIHYAEFDAYPAQL